MSYQSNFWLTLLCFALSAAVFTVGVLDLFGRI